MIAIFNSSHCSSVLVDVNLAKCHITDTAASSLASRCSSLTRLNLRDCHRLTDSGIITLCEIQPALQTVDVGGCNISDKAIQLTAIRCKRISRLCISHCKLVSDQSILQLATLLQVQCLDLSYCVKLRDAGIQAIAKHSSCLRSLILDGCSQVTDKAITALGQHERVCASLRSLSLNMCTSITNQSILFITRHVLHLKSLSLSGIHNINDNCIIHVGRHALSLCKLNLINCNRLTGKL